MNHKVDWKRKYLNPGQVAPVYPFGSKKPFVGKVEKVKKNMYGRISYVIDGVDVMAEELFPAQGQEKLRIRCYQRQ